MASTVDFGIDLGTTNSAISRMTPKGAEVIPVRRQNYIPSVVGIDRRGALKIGAEAASPAFQSAKAFKRLMGSSHTIPLDDGKSWTPEQLSAEVLKALRAAAKLKTNEDVVDVVITVPAMFSQPQCAATSNAARMAGLNPVVLLQEPIAAATAYLSENPVDGYYLVYDLGGGTFDVSLIRLRAREMNVVEHGGDNYLGGADLDRSVLEWALGQIDRQGGETDQFKKGAKRQQLQALCEEARISLSDQESATIYLDDFDLPITKLELSQQNMADLAELLISRTIDLAKDRLKAVPKSEKARAVLLVGGPTQSPYVRERLESELGLPLNYDEDPMTVVSRGAAIHASSILRNADKRAVAAGKAEIDLVFDPVSPEEVTIVAGKVVSPADFRGDVCLSLSNGDWETGWEPLVNGAFGLNVTLGRQQISEFRVQLRDVQGRLVDCEPSEVSIRSGVRAAQPVTPYNYGAVLEGGTDLTVIVKQGAPLPASGSMTFGLVKTLVAGSQSIARIYFVEGNSSHAGDNVEVGSLEIKGVDLKRTLRENERIEVRIRMSESRDLSASVHIPLVDLDYDATLLSVLDAPNFGDLEASLRETKKMISELDGYLSEEEVDLVTRVDRQTEQVEAGLERLQEGEIGEAERVQQQLSDARTAIRSLQTTHGVDVKYARTSYLVQGAIGLCRQFGDRMGLAKLEDLQSDADRAKRLGEEKTLDVVYERVLDAYWEHYGKTRDCWEYQIQCMKESAHRASDPLTYFELLRAAQVCLANDDYAGVHNQQQRMWTLLPNRDRMESRFQDAALRQMRS